MKKPVRFNGIAMTEQHERVLEELAKCPKGSTAVHGVMSGGLLAALVQMGLADRIEPDALGGNRYAVNTAGTGYLAKRKVNA